MADGRLNDFVVFHVIILSQGTLTLLLVIEFLKSDENPLMSSSLSLSRLQLHFLA